MNRSVAIIGAGVSGLTCGVLFAERGWQPTIFAEETGPSTTSSVAAAIWFPYDVEPFEQALRWALQSYEIFRELSRQAGTAVSMIELRTYSRAGAIPIPTWAAQFGAAGVEQGNGPQTFASGFTMPVPLIDTTIYLDYLGDRFVRGGGHISAGKRLNAVGDAPPQFRVVINCAGIGAARLVPDEDVEPHRGQVVLVPKLGLEMAVVCDDAPLMYVIPRTNDTVFGGTNDVSYDRQPDPNTTAAIVSECCRVLNISPPQVIAEKVGLRPFRRTGVRIEKERLGDDRTVIHNYGHGGAGFTLSWGCAEEVLRLACEGCS